MEIIEVNTKKQKQEYIDFIYKIYKNDKNYCDMNIIFVKNFLYQKDSYSKRCKVIPILIKDENMIKLECMFIIDDSKEIKLSFIEFLPHISECEFRGCTHIKEKKCGVKNAVEKMKIDKGRYERYCTLYQKLKEDKKW